MNKESSSTEKFPSAEELARRREEIAKQVDEDKQKKGKIVTEKVDLLLGENGLDNIKKIDEKYQEAKKNLEFFRKLKEQGELAESIDAKIQEEENLVKMIEDEIDKRNETSKKMMGIPEVKEKIIDIAEKENEEYIKNQKEKENHETLTAWIDKFVQEVEMVQVKLNDKRKELKESEESLTEFLKGKLAATGYKVNNIYQLRKELNTEKKYLKFFEFSKKKEIDSILNSDELAHYEECQKDLKSMQAEISPGGYESSHELFYITHHLFEQGELKEELKKIIDFSRRDIINQELKKRGEIGDKIWYTIESFEEAISKNKNSA